MTSSQNAEEALDTICPQEFRLQALHTFAMPDSSDSSSSSEAETEQPELAEACGSSSSGEEPASPKRRGRVALFTAMGRCEEEKSGG